MLKITKYSFTADNFNLSIFYMQNNWNRDSTIYLCFSNNFKMKNNNQHANKNKQPILEIIGDWETQKVSILSKYLII